MDIRAPGNIEDLDKYTSCCGPRDPWAHYNSSPQRVFDDLVDYTKNQNQRRDYLNQFQTQLPVSRAAQLLDGFVDFGVTVCSGAVKQTIRTYENAHDRVVRSLVDSQRRRMCRRAETHDIAVLPPSKPKVTARNQDLSPLLRLPLELRVQIYEYTYAHPAIITISEVVRHNSYRLLGHVRLSGQHTPKCGRNQSCECSIRYSVLALPLTCRQTYTDTIHYLYDKATFRLTNNRLILSLPSTLPAKHLRNITALSLRFDYGTLVTALHLPQKLHGLTGLHTTTTRRREYIAFWHFLATALSNLRTLIVSFSETGADSSDLELEIYKWLLAPLVQSNESVSGTFWSSKLTVFDVRLPHMPWSLSSQETFISGYREDTPFFLGRYCECALDCRHCYECRCCEEYCSRRATGARVTV